MIPPACINVCIEEGREQGAINCVNGAVFKEDLSKKEQSGALM